MIEGRWIIPACWIWVYAGEIADVISGGTPSTSNPSNFTKDGIPWLTPADLSNNKSTYVERGTRDISEKGLKTSSARILPKGTVLFTSRAPIGYCAIAANEISTNQGFKSFVLDGGISSEFVRYYLLSAKAYAESLASGSTFKELSGKRVESLEIPLPPLNEQRRIVAKIEALKARSQQVKEALDAIPLLLDQFRQSVLAAAFRGDLTADWREKNPDIEPASVLLERIRAERKEFYKEECKKAEAEGRRKPTSFKENIEPIELSKLPVIPNTWCYEKLVNLSNILGGVTKGRSFGNRATIMLPYLRVANVQDGFLDLTEIKEIEALPEDLEKYHLEYGDLLFTEGGDRDKLGRGTVWRNNIENCIHQNHVYRSRLYNSGIICDYISFATKSDYAKAYFFEKASQTTNLASINITSLGNVPLAIPPKEEQKEIVYRVQTFFKAADNINQQYREAKAYLDQLDQSILAKAFRGELVPQDPNDEPASVLLERIQAERAKREAEAKAAKKSTSKVTGGRSRKAKQQDSESIQLGLPGLE